MSMGTLFLFLSLYTNLEQLLSNGPADTRAVLDAGAASQLVHNHQGVQGSLSHHERDLLHFHHERRGVRFNAVTVGDPGEYSVRNP